MCANVRAWVVVVGLDAQAASEVPPQDSADPSSPFQEQDDAMRARSLPWLTMRHVSSCSSMQNTLQVFLVRFVWILDCTSEILSLPRKQADFFLQPQWKAFPKQMKLKCGSQDPKWDLHEDTRMRTLLKLDAVWSKDLRVY